MAGPAAHDHAFIRGAVHLLMKVPGFDQPLIRGIDDHNVRIRAGFEASLGGKPHDPGRRRGHHVHETRQRQTPVQHAFAEQQGDARFDSGNAAGTIQHAFLPAFPFLGQREGTVIGSGNRDAAVREALPERGAIRFRPQGWGHDVLEAVPFGIGGLVEQKVLRAGFGNDRLSGLLRLADAGQTFRRGEMHDVHGRFRRFRQFQNPVDRLGLAPGRAAPGMAHGIARRFAAQLVPQKTGDGVVFAMDGEQAARIPERGENL